MRFALDELQLDAQDTISKLVLEDDALRRLDEFGAFDPALVAVTFVEIGSVGLDVPADRYGADPALAAAAQLLGLGHGMLVTTVEYVKQRQQFGVPIGSFQAIKHQLADALKELAFARPAVWRAAETRDRIHVSMAKAMASDAASFVARRALQCHGAIGYTVEYDLHRFLKQTWVLARAHGDAAWHREQIAKELHL
jgi:alkylation response protein AidB-like acyl-CoA dehydrogenase